ncbi:MAG: agmatinase [Candidatus Heimdallarchaeota archaeon]
MTEEFCGTFLVEEIESAIDVDAVIIGVPFEDTIDFYTEGSSLAPTSIRKSSQFYSGQGLQEQSIHRFNVLDFGDIDQELPYEEMQNQLSTRVKTIINKNAIPVILGGDHSIALGTTKGFVNSNQKLDAIIWIDAHLDLMNEFPENNKNSRATVLKRIIEQKLIQPENVYFIGIRGHNLGWEEVEYTKQNKMKILSASEVKDDSKRNKFIEEILRKHKNLYISLDIDVLDPAFAPGVSVPEPGGITTRELFEITTKLAKGIRCFEVVEVNPQLDINSITSKTAANIIFKLFDAL